MSKKTRSYFKGKKTYSEYVFLFTEEHERLVSDFGNKVVSSVIEDLDNYIGQNPQMRVKKYKDHNRTIRAWIKKNGIQSKGKSFENICPKCNKNIICVNGLCKQCNDLALWETHETIQ